MGSKDRLCIERKTMDNQIDFHTLISRFEENSIPYGVLSLKDGACLVISQRGGRIFGPFLEEDSPSLFWMNQAFAQPGARSLASGH
jgi:hypothetical protein